MSYVEQYYLANSGDILASFLASACANKLFARQIRILAFAFFDSANTICKYKNGNFVSLSAYRGNKIKLFGKNDSRIVSATQKKKVQRRTPSSVKCKYQIYKKIKFDGIRLMMFSPINSHV